MQLITRRQLLATTWRGGGSLALLLLATACSGGTASTAAPANPTAAGGGAAPASATAPTAVAAAQTSTPLPASEVQVTPGATATAEAANIPGPGLVAMPPKSPQPITLRFHMRSGGDKAEAAIYVYRPQEWEQATGNKVQLEPIPGGSDYIPKILALAASGTIGDLTWDSDVYSEHTHLVENNVLFPVDEYLQSYHISKNEWFKAIVDGLTINGKMYGLPKTGHPGDCYIWINLDMFKAAGIPEPPTYGNTWDDVRTWANKLAKGPADSRQVYGLYSGISGIMPVTNGVRTYGGDLVSADGTKSLVNTDAFKSWLQWNYNVVVKDKLHPLGPAVPSSGIQGLFAAGKVAMVHEQRFFQFAARNAVQNKFAFTTIQLPRTDKAIGWESDIDTHSGTAAGKYRDQTFTLLYALADRRFAYLVGKYNGYLSGRLDNLEDLGPYASDHFLQLQQKCTEQELPLWRAKNLRAYEFESTLDNTLDLIWLGKAQPDQDFVNQLEKALDNVLAKPMS
jgi:ABC-type glycerol-3-phosphate transport system substrate-binding protein